MSEKRKLRKLKEQRQKRLAYQKQKGDIPPGYERKGFLQVKKFPDRDLVRVRTYLYVDTPLMKRKIDEAWMTSEEWIETQKEYEEEGRRIVTPSDTSLLL